MTTKRVPKIGEVWINTNQNGRAWLMVKGGYREVTRMTTSIFPSEFSAEFFGDCSNYSVTGTLPSTNEWQFAADSLIDFMKNNLSDYEKRVYIGARDAAALAYDRIALIRRNCEQNI